MPNVFLYLWLQELHSLLTIAASQISYIISVKSQTYSLNFIYFSYDFLSCNPLYLLFIALSNQFLLFLMIQIKNNYKCNSLVLVRKENRSKCSYLCNSFVMDQIIKMKCADTTHCQEKKKNYKSTTNIHRSQGYCKTHIYFSQTVTQSSVHVVGFDCVSSACNLLHSSSFFFFLFSSLL